jgi:hypothetical protein
MTATLIDSLALTIDRLDEYDAERLRIFMDVIAATEIGPDQITMK